MNGTRRKDIDRKVRQVARTARREIATQTYDATLRLPLPQRLWLALRIIIGRHSKPKPARAPAPAPEP